MFLNVLLHQSLTTTSSNSNATIGSLETALSSMQTSVISVDKLLRKTKLTTKEGITFFNKTSYLFGLLKECLRSFDVRCEF